MGKLMGARFLILAPGLLLMISCARGINISEKKQGVRLGMTTEDVRKELGEPYSVSEREDENGHEIVWTYIETESNFWIWPFRKTVGEFTLRFRDDKLTSKEVTKK